MTEEYMYAQPEAASPSQAPGDRSDRSRFEKILRFFIVIAVLCLAAELVWLLGITPFRPFLRIEVSGYEGIDRAEILYRAGINNRSTFFSTDSRAVEKALAGISSLESVRVFKHFPDRIQILLEPRQPLAYALAQQDGRTVTVLFDSNGVVFRLGGMDEILPYTLPVISGLIIEDPFPGLSLPPLFTPFFNELEKIGFNAPELLGVVSEFKISPRPFSGFDIILYPVHRQIKVRLSELNEDTLRYALLMVDVLASTEGGIDILDFRSGIASYIPKEAPSE